MNHSALVREKQVLKLKDGLHSSPKMAPPFIVRVFGSSFWDPQVLVGNTRCREQKCTCLVNAYVASHSWEKIRLFSDGCADDTASSMSA